MRDLIDGVTYVIAVLPEIMLETWAMPPVYRGHVYCDNSRELMFTRLSISRQGISSYLLSMTDL